MRLRLALAAPLAAAAVAATMLASSTSFAFERQWHVGGNLGYTALMGAQQTRHGLGGGLHLTYGLSDTLNLMAEVNVSSHFSRLGEAPVDAGGKPTGPVVPVPGGVLASGAVGVGYVVDVLQLVPYVGALVGAADFLDAAGHSPRLNLEVPFGLDYSISRSFAVGVGGRYQMMIGSPAGLEHGLSGFLRAEYVWGY
jgi:hypothetical protein